MSGTTLGDAMPAIPLVIAHSHFGLMWIVAVAAGLAALGATTAAVRQGSVIRSCSPNGGSWPGTVSRGRPISFHRCSQGPNSAGIYSHTVESGGDVRIRKQ
jgi:hypothetical protein